MLKLIWIGSGILLFIYTINLYIKILQSGQIDEANPARALLEPAISGTVILIIHGFMGLLYILFQKYKTHLKKFG